MDKAESMQEEMDNIKWRDWNPKKEQKKIAKNKKHDDGMKNAL